MDNSSGVTAGMRLGPYEILSRIGAGGMGEVFKARDTRLNRTAALKILLPQHDSPDWKHRFEREAKAVAALSHPHICVLYDIGNHDGIDYIVMEYLEGETLEARLSRGALPLDQALQFAMEIADALDEAHTQGVVHRDLKPGNIMLTASGAKLLDFGLAKSLGDNVGGATSSTIKTGSAELTAQGTILGTVQYMSPEQLEGQQTDARSDIFSFGMVAYEMLAGRKAFEGNSQASLIAAILKNEPASLGSPQSAVSPALDHVILGCMSKNPADRWQTAHDVHKQLKWIASAPPETSAFSPPDSKQRARSNPGYWIATIATLAIVTAISLLYAHRGGPDVLPMRLSIGMPANVSLVIGENPLGSAAISPDGTRLAFRGVDRDSGKIFLYIRPIDSMGVTAIPDTEEAASPFWSPDSRSIAFFARGKLKRVDWNGGVPQIICDAPTNRGAGTWNRDGVIIASLSDPGPLVRVLAVGGSPVPITSIKEPVELDHDLPHFLPDGKHFLYAAFGRSAADNAMFIGSLDSQESKLLRKGATAVTFAHPGYLLFLSMGNLMAQSLDVNRQELLGEPLLLAEGALPPFSASDNGTVTFRNRTAAQQQFIWINPEGSEIGPAAPPGYYTDAALSPDGSRLAFAKQESETGTMDVWILNLGTGNSTPFTVDPANDRSPVWSPDGRSIVFASNRPSAPGLYRKNADGTGAEELIVAEKGDIWPYQWTSDGKDLLYFGGPGLVDYNVGILSFPNLKARQLLGTPFVDVDGIVSPDGRWLAYASNGTGRYEIYLTSFPPSATKLVVTTISGADPMWSRDGRQLYFVNSSSLELMVTDVSRDNPPQFGQPRRVHHGPLDWTSAHSFDIDPKGRVLIQKPNGPPGDLSVLLNWETMLKK